MAREKRGGCFKIGLIGCAAAVVLGVVAVAVVAGFAVLVGPPDLEVRSIADDTGSPPIPPPAVDVGQPGRILLDVSMTEFAIVPGEAGEPLRLRGQYDAGSFELSETWGEYGETGWTYELRFRRRGGIRSMFRTQAGDHNRVELVLPRDVPLVIEGRIGVGESSVELGGLAVGSIDLEIGVGSHNLHFSEPLPIPMEWLRLEASIGELRVHDLGNASPAEVAVEHDIGEMLLDLRGPWQRDAQIIVECGVGECLVRVPQDVHLAVDRIGVMVGEASRVPSPRSEPPEGAPTLSISVSASVGEVRLLP